MSKQILPDVVYESSITQVIMDDWRTALEEHLLPVHVVCDQCHGVVHAEKLANIRHGSTGRVRIAGGTLAEDQAIGMVNDIAQRLDERFDYLSSVIYSRGVADKLKRHHYTENAMVAADVLKRYGVISGSPGILVTTCKNCNVDIEIELPGIFRSDQREAIMRQIGKEVPVGDSLARGPEPAGVPKEVSLQIDNRVKRSLGTTDYVLIVGGVLVPIILIVWYMAVLL